MTIMEGAAERQRRSIESDVALAWRVEYFSRIKTLEPLKQYLDQLKPKAPQTPDEMLAVWQEHAAREPGKIRIRHIGPDGKELN